VKIDINCDMGEGFGTWKMGKDAELINYVSSVNIACGFHAGDATTMRETAKLAIEKGVKIGVHPGYPDLQGFGRRNMNLSPQEIYDICVYQIGAMNATVRAMGGKLYHVKPHGTMYNAAAKHIELARAIVEAVKAVDANLVLYGLANSFLISEAKEIGLKTAAEAFADRTYQPDGSLTSRNEENALIKSTDEAVGQVRQIVESQTVMCVDGSKIPLKAETICIHGDGEHAVAFAKAIWEAMRG
jgi:UPF0271 protein